MMYYQQRKKIVRVSMIVFGLVFVIIGGTIFLITTSLKAERAESLKTFGSETVKDPVFKGLKEFSTLPIDVSKVEVGRDNPFKPFE